MMRSRLIGAGLRAAIAVGLAASSLVAALPVQVAAGPDELDDDPIDWFEIDAWARDLADIVAGGNRGLPWPDGGYRVWMRSSGAGAGAVDGTTGTGMAVGGTTFDVLIEGGAVDASSDFSSTEYLMVWRFVGSGSAPGLGSGSIDGTIFERGRVVADDGIVSLVRDTADLDGTVTVDGFAAPLSMIPTQDLGRDAVPVIATTARCGFVEGYWLGKLEAMLLVTSMFPSVRASAASTFVATGGPLVDVDFERLRGELDHAIDTIEEIGTRIGSSDAADRSLADELHREIGRVEALIAALSTTRCGGPGESTSGYGIGLTAAVSNVLARALAPSEDRTSVTLWRFVSAGARVNAVGAGGLGPLNSMGLDRVVEVWGREGADPDAVLTLQMTAAALGDRDLANQILGER